jgi:sugar-phosphatase
MILRASALLFDNDGVLVDSHAAVNVAWGILGEEFGLEGFSISNHYGTRAQDLILELVGEARFEAANNRINELEQATADQTHALPGAVDLLHSLPAGIWTICTSANSNLYLSSLLAGTMSNMANLRQIHIYWELRSWALARAIALSLKMRMLG